MPPKKPKSINNTDIDTNTNPAVDSEGDESGGGGKDGVSQDNPFATSPIDVQSFEDLGDDPFAEAIATPIGGVVGGAGRSTKTTATRSAAGAALPPKPKTVGEQLVTARQAQGYNLDQVAMHLKIPRVTLIALEAGDYRNLPPDPYTIGFIRSYASMLGLDGHILVGQFRREVALFRDPSLVFEDEMQNPDSGRGSAGMAVAAESGNSGLLIILVLIAIALGYYAVSRPSNRQQKPEPVLIDQSAAQAKTQALDAAENTAALPAIRTPIEVDMAGNVIPPSAINTKENIVQSTAPIAQPIVGSIAEQEGVVNPSSPADAVVTSVTDSSDSALSGTIIPEIANVPEVSAEVTKEVAKEVTKPVMAEAVETKADQSEKPPSEQEKLEQSLSEATKLEVKKPSPVEPQVAVPLKSDVIKASNANPNSNPNSNVGRQIILTAREDTWIQVEAADGEVLFSRVLRPNETYAVQPLKGQKLSTGNAGGLSVRVDGETLQSIGNGRTVVRGILLDPDRLLAIYPPKSP